MKNPTERVYLSLSSLYLEWLKIKRPKHPLHEINQKDILIQAIKSILGKKTAVKFSYI